MDQPTVAELDYLDHVMHKENRTDLEELEYRLMCPADRLVVVPVTHDGGEIGSLRFYRAPVDSSPPIYHIPWNEREIDYLERTLAMDIAPTGDIRDKLSFVIRAWHEYQRRRQEYQVRRLAIDREGG